MLAGLPYELPPELEAEAYLDAINWINRLRHKHTSPATPYELVTKTRSFLPKFPCGQVGLFYSNKKNIDQRSEWGILLILL